MTPDDFRALHELRARALARRPDLAAGNGHALARLASGLACDVEHEGRTLRVDLPPEEGGTATGPHPGQLMRASVGACLAMSYRTWAARLDVPLDEVEVALDCAYDLRGQMGLAPEVAVGWQRMSVDVIITSPAPEADLRRVVETANRMSPMLANLSRDIRQIHRLTVVRGTKRSPDGHASHPEG